MESDTRSRLLKATRQLIDEAGLDSVTLRNVGERANLSRGAAYRYFPDKEALLAEIAAENFQNMLKAFERKSLEGLGVEDQVKAMLADFYSFGVTNGDHYRLMFSTEWDEARFPRLREYALAVFKRAEALVARFAGGKESGAAGATVLAAIAFSFVHGLVELRLAGHAEAAKGLDDPDRLFDIVIRMISREGG
jgi:AcrR family transcriptional regulator